MRPSAAALVVLLAPAAAEAEDYWNYTEDTLQARAGGRVRLSPRMNIWTSNYARPQSACKDFGGFFGADPIPPPFELGRDRLRVAQFDSDFFCDHESSTELGMGVGGEVAFRVIGPFYVTIGLDLIYTAPFDRAIQNQLVVAVPFGAMLTYYGWMFRPILHVNVQPVLYVTDGRRDYTLGAALGLAWLMGEFGDLSLTVGHHRAETLSNWQIQLGVHPIF